MTDEQDSPALRPPFREDYSEDDIQALIPDPRFLVAVDEVAKLTLQELNAEIVRCLHGFEHGGSSQGRKSFFDRLVWYEKMREDLHGIPAPSRRA
jgi:hypothetical protein